jgi:hypothetical protein
LQNNTVSTGSEALLMGHIFDDRGNCMGPSQSRNGRTRYRYFVLSAPIQGQLEAAGTAEEVRDPLDGLVEGTGTDPGAAFVPETLERLATLKRDDRAAFEALRAQLKKAGCRVTALDALSRTRLPEDITTSATGSSPTT